MKFPKKNEGNFKIFENHESDLALRGVKWESEA